MLQETISENKEVENNYIIYIFIYNIIKILFKHYIAFVQDKNGLIVSCNIVTL